MTYNFIMYKNSLPDCGRDTLRRVDVLRTTGELRIAADKTLVLVPVD